MSAAELNSLINLISTTITLFNQVTISFTYLNDFLGLLWSIVNTVTGFVGTVTGGIHTVVQFFAGLI